MDIKKFIQEEVSKLHKKTLLENKKSQIEKQLILIKENKDISTMKKELDDLSTKMLVYDREEMYDEKDKVEQEYYALRKKIHNIEKENELDF